MSRTSRRPGRRCCTTPGIPTTRCSRSGIDFAVLELFVRYRRPLYFDEPVDIHVVAADLTRTTFQVGYLLEVAGQARSTAVTVHGAVDPAGRPVRMPSWLTDAGGPFLSSGAVVGPAVAVDGGPG